MTEEELMELAIELAEYNVREHGGQPFGAVVAMEGEVIATGMNSIRAKHDPTAHAEMEAIRAACEKLQTLRLDGAIVYASGYPCPMCLSAMHQAGIEQMHYAYPDVEAEPYGFSTAMLYREMSGPPAELDVKIHYLPVRLEGVDLFELWLSERAKGR